MSGKAVHFEIPFDDAERAQSFEAGYIGGGMLKRESPADRPVSTIDVEGNLMGLRQARQA